MILEELLQHLFTLPLGEALTMSADQYSAFFGTGQSEDKQKRDAAQLAELAGCSLTFLHGHYAFARFTRREVTARARNDRQEACF
ncbi:MAG TPA: hypothetical protein VGN97_02455 [Mesorhizobium sp.]|jgi:hypothetical protein|nr:hypothetical protein [Mesorhizobium sp.]